MLCALVEPVNTVCMGMSHGHEPWVEGVFHLSVLWLQEARAVRQRAREAKLEEEEAEAALKPPTPQPSAAGAGAGVGVSAQLSAAGVAAAVAAEAALLSPVAVAARRDRSRRRSLLFDPLEHFGGGGLGDRDATGNDRPSPRLSSAGAVIHHSPFTLATERESESERERNWLAGVGLAVQSDHDERHSARTVMSVCVSECVSLSLCVCV